MTNRRPLLPEISGDESHGVSTADSKRRRIRVCTILFVWSILIWFPGDAAPTNISAPASSPDQNQSEIVSVPRNLKVLSKTTTTQELTKQMRDISAALGVECNYCHVRPFEQDTPRKQIARLMIRDYQAVLRNKDGSSITCADCHKGRPNPLRTLPFEKTFNKKPGLHVLTGANDDQVMRAMNVFNDSLGIDCDHCHEGNFDDDTSRKQITRFMMTEYEAKFIKKDGTRVSCNDCHQGNVRPLSVLPFR